MKGLVLVKHGEVQLQEVDKPVIKNDTDVVIKITMTTICGSDIHLMHGILPSAPPFIIGHEYVGIVEETGAAVKKFKPGDRVCGPPAVWCGRCENCLKGFTQQCANGGTHGSGPLMGDLHGAQCEYILVPYADIVLLHVPDDMPDERALLVCDNLSTGFFVLDNGDIRPGDTVVIFGAGPVGLSAVAASKVFGPKQVILVEYNEFRLQTGKKMGADYLINAKDDVVSAVMEITGGKGAELAAECSGDEKAFSDAVRCVGAAGHVSIVGIGKKLEISDPTWALMNNLTIRVGLGYLGNNQRLMDLLHCNKINLDPLITHRIKLDDIIPAYKMFEDREDNVIKIAVTP